MTRSDPPPPDAASTPEPGRFARWRLALDRAARGRWALPALFAGSVIDSTVFPWPIAFPLAAQMLRGKRYVFPAAIAVTLGSVLGCAIMYGVGLLAYEAAAAVILADPSAAAAVEAARARIETAGAWAVFLLMMTPAPVQLTSFAAALAGVGPGAFVLALIAGRTLRYFSMAVVLYFFGGAIVAWWRRLSRPARWAMIALFTAVFAGMIIAALAG